METILNLIIFLLSFCVGYFIIGPWIIERIKRIYNENKKFK